MNGENKDELQSRRQFFRKAAKGVLPIIGAIALANVPFVSNAAKTPAGCGYSDCSFSCSGTCSGGCGHGCGDNCMNSCTGCSTGCKGSCYGSCQGQCRGTCSGYNQY